MTPLHFHFLSLFPEPIELWLNTSILGRAKKRGLFQSSTYQLRDFSRDRHRTVDDTAYGGGGGMVLRLEPLVEAVESITQTLSPEPVEVICFAPHGTKIGQPLLDEMAASPTRHLIMVCGHYEGIDQRFFDHWVHREISLGDFIVTGGELPAMVLADALVRQMQGALGSEEGALKESFRLRNDQGGVLLEYPHYTRPADFRGRRVPDVLLSGDHGQIDRWRKEQAADRTRTRRPDLMYPNETLTETERSE